MTINSPAPMIFAMYLVVAEQQGADWKTLSGTIQNDILKEFIAQKEYIYPPRAVDAADHRHLRVLREGSAAVEHHLGERLSHPRGRLDGAAGAGVHAARRHRVRAVRHRRRARRRRLRAAASRSSSTRTATSSRRSPSSAPRAGSGREVMRDRFRREGRALVEAALPHPDRRRVADRAAAVQQRRPHRAAGAGRGARRHQLAAHQLARRGAGAADRRGGDAGAADAADHRPRERRHRRRRSARRLVFRRAADPRHGAGARRTTSTPSTGWAGWSRRSSRASRSARSPRASYRFQQAVERREKVIVGVNDFVQDDEPPHRRFCTSTRRAARRQLARLEALRRTRDNDAVRRSLDALREAAAAAPATRCRRCSTACAPTRRSARCATRCARSGASTKKCR